MVVSTFLSGLVSIFVSILIGTLTLLFGTKEWPSLASSVLISSSKDYHSLFSEVSTLLWMYTTLCQKSSTKGLQQAQETTKSTLTQNARNFLVKDHHVNHTIGEQQGGLTHVTRETSRNEPTRPVFAPSVSQLSYYRQPHAQDSLMLPPLGPLSCRVEATAVSITDKQVQISTNDGIAEENDAVRQSQDVTDCLQPISANCKTMRLATSERAGDVSLQSEKIRCNNNNNKTLYELDGYDLHKKLREIRAFGSDHRIMDDQQRVSQPVTPCNRPPLLSRPVSHSSVSEKHCERIVKTPETLTSHRRRAYSAEQMSSHDPPLHDVWLNTPRLRLLAPKKKFHFSARKLRRKKQYTSCLGDDDDDHVDVNNAFLMDLAIEWARIHDMLQTESLDMKEQLWKEHLLREQNDAEVAKEMMKQMKLDIHNQRLMKANHETTLMRSTAKGKAVLLVESILSLSLPDGVIPVARDKMTMFAEKFFITHERYKNEGKPHHVGFGYHRTKEHHFVNIQMTGLLTQAELKQRGVRANLSGNAFGPGIYVSNNPIAFKCFGRICLLCLILRGREQRVTMFSGQTLNVSEYDSALGNKRIGRNIAPTHNLFFNEIVLGSSEQIVPILALQFDDSKSQNLRLIRLLERTVEKVVDFFGQDATMSQYPTDAPAMWNDPNVTSHQHHHP